MSNWLDFIRALNYLSRFSLLIVLRGSYLTPSLKLYSVFNHLEGEEFSQFRRLIEIADMEEEIAEEFAPSENEDEPLVPVELVTLFAPTNDAFDRLPEEQKDKLFGEGMLRGM